MNYQPPTKDEIEKFRQEHCKFLASELATIGIILIKRGKDQIKAAVPIIDKINHVLKLLEDDDLDFANIYICSLKIRTDLGLLLVQQPQTQFPKGGVLTPQTNDETPKYGGVNEGEIVI